MYSKLLCRKYIRRLGDDISKYMLNSRLDEVKSRLKRSILSYLMLRQTCCDALKFKLPYAVRNLRCRNLHLIQIRIFRVLVLAEQHQQYACHNDMSHSHNDAREKDNTRSTASPNAQPIHYPFWFGGSASCCAATVTHPLDLSKHLLPSCPPPSTPS